MKKKFTGFMCGGVVSKSTFYSDPWAYMMARYMDDKQYEKYVAYKEAGKNKEAKRLFDKYAISAI